MSVCSLLILIVCVITRIQATASEQPRVSDTLRDSVLEYLAIDLHPDSSNTLTFYTLKQNIHNSIQHELLKETIHLISQKDKRIYVKPKKGVIECNHIDSVVVLVHVLDGWCTLYYTNDQKQIIISFENLKGIQVRGISTLPLPQRIKEVFDHTYSEFYMSILNNEMNSSQTVVEALLIAASGGERGELDVRLESKECPTLGFVQVIQISKPGTETEFNIFIENSQLRVRRKNMEPW